MVGDVTKVPNPQSGREMLAMAPAAVPVAMKEYVTFAATRSLPLPKGWLIPKTLVAAPRMAAALDRLRWHGIKIQEFAERPAAGGGEVFDRRDHRKRRARSRAIRRRD